MKNETRDKIENIMWAWQDQDYEACQQYNQGQPSDYLQLRVSLAITATWELFQALIAEGDDR